MELKLLKLFTDRYIYNKYIKHINKDYLEDITINILDDYKVYYDTFAVDTVDLENFNTFIFSVLRPTLKTESRVKYQKVIDNLKSVGTVDEGILSFFKEKELYSGLVEKSLWGLEKGTSVLPEIETLIREHKESSAVEKDSCMVDEDIHALASRVVGGTGLNWRLKELNISMGPLRTGNFLVVGARPEAGKTTFLASESTFMQQFMEPEQSVVWFNNEEEGRKVLWRVIQSALGWTKEQMVENLDDTYDAYIEVVGRKNKILIHDSHSITQHNIEATLKAHPPGLIIFDQLRKVKGFETDSSDVLRLQRLYQYARELAKEYAPVINVHQADGSAEGVQWIQMNQLYGSKTDIQGEVDAILTIGKSNDEALENNRFFHLPKNKLSGGPLSEEKWRHGRFEIILDRERGRFKSP